MITGNIFTERRDYTHKVETFREMTKRGREGS